MQDIKVEEVNTDDFTMEYFKFGKGKKNLAIIPGVSVQSVMPYSQAIASRFDCLSQDFTVYVFDRRKDMPVGYTVEDAAKEIAEAFDKLGLKDVNIYGASQGGNIALSIAADHPELVNKLVLASTTLRSNDENYNILNKWVDIAKKGDATQLYISFGEYINPAETYEALKDAYAAAGKAVTPQELKRFVNIVNTAKDFDVTSRLNNIKAPTLVVFSADDRVFGKKYLKEVAEYFKNRPDSEILEYENYGHAVYDNAPDFPERMYEFLMKRSKGV
ncbi:MAG: alpha/beta hydrolase [Firmicutes bacterium]|nr:alpha/beta hydrolase [Bacillota bacterium]